VIPGRIIPHISLDHTLRPPELVFRIKETKALHQPLPVAPNVIVFCVLLQHGRNEVTFPFAGPQGIDNGLAVMPDLVILEVFECRWIEPLDFVAQRGLELAESLCAIEPGYCQCRLAS